MVSEKLVEEGIVLAAKAAKAVAPELSREVAAASTRILDGIYESSGTFKPLINAVRSTDSAGEHAWQMSKKHPALKTIKGDQLHILEIGSNQDSSAAHILDKRLSKYISVDLTENPQMTSNWTDSLVKSKISTENKFRVKGDVLDLPIKSASMDAVLVSSVPPFVFKEEQAALNERAIAEAARVLKPGGKLVLFDYGPDAVENAQQLLAKHFQSQSFVRPNMLERLQQKLNAIKFLTTSPDTMLIRSVSESTFIATK